MFRTAAPMAAVVLALTAPAAPAQVSGRVRLTDAGGQPATDVGNAVVYIEGRGPRGTPVRAGMALESRQFRPRVLVVPTGSTVEFPNQDPFNHNVFSLSEPSRFDLGLYGRGQVESQRFPRPGLVRVFCNIHPRMSGFVLVRENAWYAQPGADGGFTLPGVPPGTYTLKVWHERAPEVTQEITVPSGGLSGVTVTMDASGYRWVQHRDKNGREYGSGAARERY